MKNTGIFGFLKYGLAFSLLLLCTVPALSVNADIAGDNAYVIADFSKSADGFAPLENVYSARYRKLTLGGEERLLLDVTSYGVMPGDMRSVRAKFDEPLDFSKYRKIRYDIFVPEYAADPNAVYYTRLTLNKSDGSSIKYLGLVTGGEWSTVEVDISAYGDRSNIVSAEIAVTIDTTLPKRNAYSFYIDEIYADEIIDRELSERFLFDVYSLTGGTATLSADKKSILMVPSQTEEMMLEALVSLPEMFREANALRIKLINNTEADKVTLYYSTSDTLVSTEDKSVVIPISKNGEAQYVYAGVGDVSMLNSIKLVFAPGTGSVELLSISPIMQYKADEFDTCGSVNSCFINDDLATVSFIGVIDRDTAIENQSGQIAIYACDGGTLPTDEELRSMTPLTTGLMSARFDLKWQIPRDNPHAANSRFIAVILREDGGYTLIEKPFYLSNPERMAKMSASLSADLKGFSATDISLVGDSNAGITLLELDFGEAFASKSEGFQYIYNGRAYYLNENYLDSIVQKTDAFYGAGVQVLLRFKGMTQEYAAELTDLYLSDSYFNYAKMTDADAGADYIGALSAYVAENLCHEKKIIGVIYGSLENVVSVDKSISDSVAYTADSLRRIYMNLAAANSSAKLYVSLTDLMTSEYTVDSEEMGVAEYLPLLIQKTEEYGQFPWELSIEKVYRDEKSEGAEYIDITDCSQVCDILRTYGCMGKRIIFCDSTYKLQTVSFEEKLKSLVVGYYSALFEGQIDAYIADAAENGAVISEAMRLIDTADEEKITSVAANLLGVESVFTLFSDFDANRLASKRLTYCEASTFAPENTRGRFEYYKFSGISSIGDIHPGYYSKSLRIVSDTGNVLSAPLDGTLYGDSVNPEWMGIFHRFEYAEDFSLTPILELTMKLTKVKPTTLAPVPVKLVLLGDHERFEAYGEVIPGEWTTLYIDVGNNFSSADSVAGLQILVGGGEISAGSLSLKSLDGLSREYNDESLESLVEESREKRQASAPKDDYTKFLWVGGGIVVAAATVIVIALLSRKREEIDE